MLVANATADAVADPELMKETIAEEGAASLPLAVSARGVSATRIFYKVSEKAVGGPVASLSEDTGQQRSPLR